MPETGHTNRDLLARIRELPGEKRVAIERLLKKQGVDFARLLVSVPSERPLVPVGRDRDLPLSFAQQRVWFLQQLDPQTSALNLQLRIGLRAGTDVLERAVNALIARHEVLRTTYRMGAHEPIQIVHAPYLTELPVVDLRGLPPGDVAKEGIRIANQQRELPFDLEAGPVWRALAFKLSNDHVCLSMTIHHIATDGWSLNRLLQEARVLCEAYAQGTGPALPPLHLQYADYAVWQREWLQDEVLDARLQYWRERLAGMPSELELLTDFPRPATLTYSGATVCVQIGEPLANALRALAKNHRVTLFVALLALFKVLLCRYSGQYDIVVGIPVAGRAQPEVENVQGLFLNSLVLRTDLSRDPTFAGAMARVSESVLGALAHQDLPFEELVRALQPQRSLGRNPLFQAFFNKPIVPELSKQYLPDGPIVLDQGQGEFDVALWVEEHSGIIALGFNFNTDLFRSSTIERMAGHYIRLAEAVVSDSQQHIRRLPLLSDGERRQLLEEWNRTGQMFPGDPVTRLFERAVAEAPDAIALEFEGERLSYRQLNARANRLARYLQLLGVGPEVKVGVFLERSPEMVAGVLGVLKAGGAYVPLDPAYPAERLAFMLEDSQAAVLLTQDHLLPVVPAHAARVVNLDRDAQAIAGQGTDNLDDAPGASDLAYMIYTSGSSGRPKGVQIPHSALSNFLQSMVREPGMERHDVLLAVTTLSFDIAGLELYLPLISGARVVLASRDTAADGAALAALLRTSEATVMQATPATWRLLLAAGWQGSPKLKILCGGEALPRELAEALLPRCASLWNLYGPTESTIWSAAYRVESGAEAVPVGRPISNTRIYLLDEYLQPVPVGVAGELHIGGTGLARGYWQRPELNAQCFIADLFGGEPGARLYKTGDRARYLPDGNIEYLGRLDDQVKLRGFRVELGEIEARLERLPGVRQAAAQVREDRPGDQRLVAYVICEDNTTLSPEQIRSFLAQSLPAYMVPSAYVFLDTLPLTPNGKVDRKALPPAGSTLHAGESYVPPQTQYERELASVWSEVLGVNRVSVHDNFFDIGGHSLLAIETIIKFKERTGRSLDPRNYYQQTLGQLAASVDETAGTMRRVSTAAVIELEPFFFGSEARLLYGLLRLAPNPRSVGIVLCQPHAHEYIRCHRAFRELGQRLAWSGFHVLSFDYYGTGDSGGDYEQGRISGWAEDTALAISTLKQRSEVKHVCLVGLRLGATLAMTAAAGRGDIDGIALWDPIVAGSDADAEVTRIQALQALDPVRQRDITYADVLSYPLTPEMANDLRQIDLCALQCLSAPALLVLETESEGSGRRLANRAKTLGSRVDYRCISEARVWLREPYEAIVPQDSMRAMASWISERFP